MANEMQTAEVNNGVDNPQTEEKQTMSITLVKETRGVRGKGNKDKKVEFLAIPENAPRPENLINEILELVGQNQQDLWERFILGFNEYAYQAIADPIAAYIDSSWDDEKVKAFRGTVNQFAKLMGKDREEIAEKLLAEMNAGA